MSTPDIETVRELAQKVSNWGRFGDDDEKGTLNLTKPDHVIAGAQLVRQGKTISMALTAATFFLAKLPDV